MFFAYCRVSTADQARDDRTSLPEQARKARAVADLRGVEPAHFQKFVDDGVSGTIPLSKRPAGKEMLRQAQAGDVICATKMDRLFRSASDALRTAEKLKERGIELILIDLGVEPVTANGTAKLFFGVLALMAEFERERIAERCQEGRDGKKQRLGHIGGDAPFGYAVEGHGKSAIIVPIEHEQMIVRRARSLRNRYNLSEIARILNEDGSRSRSGSPFQAIQIKRMVSQRAYGNGVG